MRGARQAGGSARGFRSPGRRSHPGTPRSTGSCRRARGAGGPRGWRDELLLVWKEVLAPAQDRARVLDEAIADKLIARLQLSLMKGSCHDFVVRLLVAGVDPLSSTRLSPCAAQSLERIPSDGVVRRVEGRRRNTPLSASSPRILPNQKLGVVLFARIQSVVEAIYRAIIAHNINNYCSSEANRAEGCNGQA